MRRGVVVGCLFVVGFGLVLFPVVSNWVQSLRHDVVIANHRDVVRGLPADMREAELERARGYNDGLLEDEIAFHDPFGADGDAVDVALGYYDVLDVGEVMGDLEVPRLGVRLPIYHGVSDDVLSRGIGHMANSSVPVGGAGTHAALTGHRGLPSAKLFRELDVLDIGDLFYIHVLGDVLAYEVDQIDVVLPSETSWLVMEEGRDLVTLITCEPYMINSHRLLVRGERVDMATDFDMVSLETGVRMQPSVGVVRRNGWLLVSLSSLCVLTFVAAFARKKILSKRDVL